ncbi:ABC transporter permease [Bosea sp. 117]|uniref:ABC transporter permease n=1 Tax=Bosea sp. 117 TaxID=1125973 RepID=UPI00049466B2|nr:ABC transporter permease [Bosea sp. 117]
MLDGFGQNRLLAAFGWAFALAMMAFLVAPSLIVVPMSFSASDFLEFPPREFSLRWYASFWESVTWLQAARASLLIGALTVALALPLGTLAAYGTRDLPPRAQVAVGAVLLMPAIIPSILVAIGLFFLLAKLDLIGTYAGVVLGHAALAMPVVYVIMTAAFADFDRNLERAAQSLGASRWTIWRTVIIPNIKGALFAAGLLAFVTSLDEVVVAMFITSGSNATLPKVMFSALRDHIDPTVAAISTMLIAVAVGAVVALLRGERRRRSA